jgi:hypothetical protein
MRESTPTRDEMVAELGEDHVEMLEGEELPDGLDLLDRLFVHAHLGPAASDEVGSAYLRARAAGTCPCHGLPDLYWEHYDIDGMCDIFPCPHCVDDNVYSNLPGSIDGSAEDGAREDDRDPEDDTIPF